MGNGTSLGRVRGLGSAKEGAHHWIVQRFTAIGNVVLMLWLVASFILLPNLSYDTVSGWLASPIPAAAMVLLIVSVFWHARLGLTVLIEDYVHEAGLKFAALAALNLAAVAGGVFGIFCIARLALGGVA
ncbi:succinate dehydrogenase, hydrophobic membrane anchor protein [Erythrobacter litoralis]|uniref:Succinate dehydrogenase hydrophobic membrane anchor subunit n=1 Tax=Erythrobacter litoralis (strain HTCC2594) TaxID=314225 RepID=Q2N9W7_ERYLH|nr:succinate dehydrogenase, hydrophobic membrane anchor protein [Erythrobacter litoralis]ABC63524.1 succinate dehydrogenase hydrophobic membrane anchor protein [Erythrobacter litoralis HTCC2594]